MNNNIFLFVVCGSQEHIETLHFSITALKRFSEYPVCVVTDNQRNAIPVQHEYIIHHTTPEYLNHHQASIYLKTRLHKILPSGNTYCYLDSDVIALSDECNKIFNEWLPPILFAPDHCKIRKFSATAVFCECNEKWERDRNIFEIAKAKYDKNTQIKDPELLLKAEKIVKYLDKLENKKMDRWITALRYHFSGNIFKLNDEFYYDKKNRCWLDAQNNIVLYEINYDAIAKDTGLTYDGINHTWRNEHNDDIWKNECNHLVQFIREDFGIIISEKNWQHWNGGVFLFNDSSHEFLESWHQKTLQIFKLKKWKTRDQGTLIATVWEFRLQHHPVLNKKWNFIADYNILGLDFNEAGEFTDDHWKSKCRPAFIHIYHRFGDDTWNVWNYVKSKLTVS
jgi:hypothetical protein